MDRFTLAAEEEARIEAGFVDDEDDNDESFQHQYVHRDGAHKDASKFFAGNDVSVLQGEQVLRPPFFSRSPAVAFAEVVALGLLATTAFLGFLPGTASQVMRAYEKLANFDWGYGGHETGELTDGKYPKKPFVSIVPLDGLMEYYSELDGLGARLEKAAVLLVRRYNAREVRRPNEWRDEICRQEFEGVNRRRETTIFELRLSSFGFHVGGLQRPMDVGDVRVQ
jgi:hypothetical protein